MTQTIPQATHAHHERLLAHIDRVPQLADAILGSKDPADRFALQDLASFMTGTLLPHMEAAEAAIYPELERMFQNRHSMAPMRREHEEIRRLSAEYLRLAAPVADRSLTLGETLALRRVMFQLYALVKVHVAEEEAYIRLMDRGTDADASEVIIAALEHPIAG